MLFRRQKQNHSDSNIFQLLPKPDQFSYCPNCFKSLKILYCDFCNKWFVLSTGPFT